MNLPVGGGSVGRSRLSLASIPSLVPVFWNFNMQYWTVKRIWPPRSSVAVIQVNGVNSKKIISSVVFRIISYSYSPWLFQVRNKFLRLLVKLWDLGNICSSLVSRLTLMRTCSVANSSLFPCLHWARASTDLYHSRVRVRVRLTANRHEVWPILLFYFSIFIDFYWKHLPTCSLFKWMLYYNNQTRVYKWFIC